MNSILLSIAVAFVLVLFGALVAPFFIDWNGYRDVVETRLSEAFGYEVVIGGPLDVRILPYPVLDIQGLEIRSEGLRFPILIVPQLSADLSLAPLLQGRIKVTDIQLDQPIATLPVDASGVLKIPLTPVPGIQREAVEISDLEVRDGTLVLVDNTGRPLKTLTGIAFSGQASSLDGPFKVEGRALTESESYTFKIASGRMREDGAIRLKINLEPVSIPRTMSLDAIVSVTDGMPELAGKFNITQSLVTNVAAERGVRLKDLPWQIGGNVEGPLDNLLLQGMSLSAGPQTRKIALEGNARIFFTPERRIEARLSARQVDFDRALGDQGEEVIRSGPGATMEVLGEVASLLSKAGFPIELSLAADVVILGGDLVESVAIDLVANTGAIELRRGEARLPGKTNFAFTGIVDPDNASVTGNIRVDSQNTANLAQWLGLDPDDFGPLFAPGERVTLVLATGLDVNPRALVLNRFKALMNDTEITGSLSFPMAEAVGRDARKLVIDLSLNELDLDQYVNFEGVGGGVGEVARLIGGAARGRDVSVQVHAGKFSVSGLTANGLSINAVLANSTLEIEQFKLDDLAGTSIDIQGRLDSLDLDPSGTISANVISSDLGGLASLAAQLGLQGDRETALIDADQAEALSPAKFSVTLEAMPDEEISRLNLSLQGTFARTQAAVNVAFRGQAEAFLEGRLSGDIEFNNPDSLAFLDQLGVDTGSAELQAMYQQNLAPASVLVAFEGLLAEALAVNADIRSLGGKASFSGNLWPGNEAVLNGLLEITSEDGRPVIALLGQEFEKNREQPFSLRSNLLLDFEHMEISDLSGEIDGNRFSGNVKAGLSASPISLGGDLQISNMSLPWLINLFVGPLNMDVPDWPRQPFDLEDFEKFSGQLGFEIHELSFFSGTELQDARFQINARPGMISLDAFEGALAGGVLTGNATFQVEEGGALFSTMFNLQNGLLEQVLFSKEGGEEDGAKGEFTLNGEMGGSGRSWRGIVSSLNGGGVYNVAPGTIRELDPAAFGRIIEAADGEMDLTDENVRQAFDGFLKSGPFVFSQSSGEFTVTAGQVSSKSVPLNSPDAQLRITTNIDIPQRILESKWIMSPNSSAGNAEAVAAVTISYSGSWNQPTRYLDTSALTNFLTVRRIENDVRELEEAQDAVKILDAAKDTGEEAAPDPDQRGENGENGVVQPDKEDTPAPVSDQNRPTGEQNEKNEVEATPQNAEPLSTPETAVQPSPQTSPITPQTDRQSGDQDTGQTSLESIIENALRESDANAASPNSSDTIIRQQLPPIETAPNSGAPEPIAPSPAPPLPPAIILNDSLSPQQTAPGGNDPNLTPDLPIISQPRRRSRGNSPNGPEHSDTSR